MTPTIYVAIVAFSIAGQPIEVVPDGQWVTTEIERCESRMERLAKTITRGLPLDGDPAVRCEAWQPVEADEG